MDFLSPEGYSRRELTKHTVDDSIIENGVWRKLDLHILPLAFLFFFLSFLDRFNIGNARVAGLQADLDLTNLQYTIALTMTCIPYIAVEIPYNLLLKFVGPHILLPTLITTWGLVTSIQGFVRSYSGLLVCRFFLGFVEGGLLPGLVLYLSFFYPEQLLHRRVSLFIATSSLTGAFSGLVAFAVMHMDGIGHQRGWSWIFILEGLFTSSFGLISYMLLPKSLVRARFLSAEEKIYIADTLERAGRSREDEAVDSLCGQEVGMAFSLPQVLMLAANFFGGTVMFALAYFTPSIIQGLGYSVMRTQLMTVPPFVFAYAVALTVAYLSNRYQCHGVVAIFCAISCIIGFLLFFASDIHNVQYASLFLSISGAYNTAPAINIWDAINTTPRTRQATIMSIAGKMGGILAAWLLGVISTAPPYFLATKILLSFSILLLVLFISNIIYLWNQDRRKAKLRRKLCPGEERPNFDDNSAWFIYHS